MMAIDLSGSMEEEDLTRGGQRATRLDVVKQAADDFLQRREGDRVGLVLFSDRAYLQSPLTFDREVVRELLGQAQVGLTGQKTAIGDAIAIAAKRLKDRAEDSRVLVLLTDGANNEGVMEPLQAAALAKNWVSGFIPSVWGRMPCR
ncbi:VWA domain-containing protein [Aliamphritea spongicola]|nr:VWA domain-containing protein [Aliamphritea spongicola]